MMYSGFGSQAQAQRNSLGAFGMEELSGQMHGMGRQSQGAGFAPTSENMRGGGDDILSDLAINRSYPPYNRPYDNMTSTATLPQPQHQSRNDSVLNDGKIVPGFRPFPGNLPPGGDEHYSRFVLRQEMTGSLGAASPDSDGLISPTTEVPGKRPPVAIPRESRESIAIPSGPTSRTHTIPPRAKPGRKPMKDEPENKRKLQNRQAQRAFRDRRAQKIEVMEKEFEEERQQFRNDLAAVNNRLASLRQDLAQANKDRDSWIERAKDLEQEKESLLASVTAAKNSSTFGSPPPQPPQ